jgi:hypothetical protein
LLTKKRISTGSSIGVGEGADGSLLKLEYSGGVRPGVQLDMLMQ